MKWFKHDADASVDAKLQALLLDYGASGYGLYWYCIELIAQGVSENNITFELEHDARIIARNLNLTVQETSDMMKYMIKLGLFSVSDNERLACYTIAKRLDTSMTSNTKMRKIITGFKQSHDKVMIRSTDSHDKVMQEEKRREEKREDNKEQLFSFTLKKLTSFENLSLEYKTNLNEYINSCKGISYKDFEESCVMKGYKYKNFKMAYDKWNKSNINNIKANKPKRLV